MKAMPDPLITILMTVYNGSRFLRSSIDSVLKQSFSNFEFLIIDDCSTDNSLEIIKSFKDKRIVIHSNSQNLGQTRSLNIGFRLARSPRIARIDADDVALPFWIKRHVDFINKNLQFSVVTTGVVIIDDSNKIRKIIRFPESQEELLLKSLVGSPISHVGSLMNRDTILGVGGYREDLKIAADFELWSTLIRKKYMITSLKDITMAVRFHQASISKTENKIETAEIGEVIYNNIKEYSNMNISREEVDLLEKFHYRPHQLSKGDFSRAEEISVSIYQKIKPSMRLSAQVIQRKLRQHLLTIYIKRIFEYPGTNNSKEIQRLARAYFKKFGFSLVLFGLLFLSFFGDFMIRGIPRIYVKVMQWLAVLDLHRRLDLREV